MKKLVLSLAVIASMSLVACGGSEKQAEAAEVEATEVEAAEEVVAEPDTVAADTVVVEEAAVVAE